jgi:rod shape-determining protein MreC
MRNLWIFINKYNAFFFFILFLIVSSTILVKNNPYQKASAWNSSNHFVGKAYERASGITNFLKLNQINDSLARENEKLLNQVEQLQEKDSLLKRRVVDTAYKQQYEYIVARVVNNSIHQNKNYITVNRGSSHGVAKDDPVIGPNGVVGTVLAVSANYATIQSLLHPDSRVSASIVRNNAYGSLRWGEGGNPHIGTLTDIPNHIQVKIGDKVVTSGFSKLPSGIAAGTIIKTGVKSGNSFLDMELRLATDFSTLQYVYVVKNKMALEQQQLEAANPIE